jgi:hypothetical protein
VRGRGLALLAQAGLALASSAGGVEPPDERAARIERQLLASCSCHPKKIAGLPLQGEVRAAIAAGIDEGLDDNAVLWRVLERHGTALLQAGVEDIALRARAVLVITPFALLLGAGAFLLQLRER